MCMKRQTSQVLLSVLYVWFQHVLFKLKLWIRLNNMILITRWWIRADGSDILPCIMKSTGKFITLATVEYGGSIVGCLGEDQIGNLAPTQLYYISIQVNLLHTRKYSDHPWPLFDAHSPQQPSVSSASPAFSAPDSYFTMHASYLIIYTLQEACGTGMLLWSMVNYSNYFKIIRNDYSRFKIIRND